MNHDRLKREAKGLLIFTILYGFGALIHFQFGSPKNAEVVRQVIYAASLALICYLLVALLRLRSFTNLKTPANAPSEGSDLIRPGR